jgi:hypothetical protein
VPSSSRLAAWALVVIAIVTIVLGLIGYSQVSDADLKGELSAAGPIGHFFDLLYLSITLLTLGSKDVHGQPVLLVARYIGVLWVFAVVIRVVAPQIEERLVWLRVRWMHGHTAIIGLGQKGRGLLAEAASTAGVVAIDLAAQDLATLKPAEASEAQWRAVMHHAVLLQGDAFEPKWLQRANTEHASRVYVVTQHDAANVEIALRIRERGGLGEHPKVVVFAHVAEERLAPDIPVDRQSGSRVTVRPFSLPGMAARDLLSRRPPAIAAREQGCERMNLVFLGFDAYAEAVLVHTLRLGSLPEQLPPLISIFAKDADRLDTRLRHNYPALFEQDALLGPLAERVRVHEHDSGMSLSPDEMHATEVLEGGSAPVTTIFVVGASDAEAELAARRVRTAANRADCWRAPLHVRLQRDARFGANPPLSTATKILADRIEPFGDLHTLCRAVHRLDWREEVAMAMHADYRPLEQSGRTAEERSPAEREWNQLGEEFREANRRAVDHFVLKLATAGWIVRGDTPLLGATLALDTDARQVLAAMEHVSWCHEKRLAGWRFGAQRDDRTRQHDYLMPYEKLGDAKAKDMTQLNRMEHRLSQVAPPGELGSIRRRRGITAFRERTIGLAGHIVINLQEAARIRRAVLPLLDRLGARQRLTADAGEFWTVVTALAPGSDIVLARAFLDALGELVPAQPGGAARYRLLVVRGLRPRPQTQRYRDASNDEDRTPDGAKTVRELAASGEPRPIERLLETWADEQAACEWVIDVAPGGPGSDDREAHERAGLAAAADYLLRRCDDLVVALDPARYQRPRPFDAARWAADEGSLPASGTGALARDWLRTRAQARPFGRPAPLAGDGLYVIDPGA